MLKANRSYRFFCLDENFKLLSWMLLMFLRVIFKYDPGFFNIEIGPIINIGFNTDYSCSRDIG